MFLINSEESLNSMESDESIYSSTSSDLILNKTNKSSCNQINKPKRKREKLDHLSNEEKLLRRKIKNRISAQSARDRKKVKMNNLEEQLAILSQERTQMFKENELLRKRNLKLEQEIKELRTRLNLASSDEDSLIYGDKDQDKLKVNYMDNDDNLSIKPAEFINLCLQCKKKEYQDLFQIKRLASVNQTIFQMIYQMIYQIFFPMILLTNLLIVKMSQPILNQLKKVILNHGVNKYYLIQYQIKNYRFVRKKQLLMMNLLMNLQQIKEQKINYLQLKSKILILSVEMMKYLEMLPII